MGSRVVSRQDQVRYDQPRDQPLDQQTPWPKNVWLILATKINDDFPAGTPVLITDYLPLTESPTRYAGQSGGQQVHNMANTLYRLKKLATDKHKFFLQSEEMSTRITGSHISSERRGRQNPRAIFTPGQLVYIIDEVPDVRSRTLNRRFKIPIDTRAMIVGPTSKAGMNARLQTADRHILPWVLYYAIQVESSRWVQCQSYGTSAHFRRPTREETAGLPSSTELPASSYKVVNVDLGDKPNTNKIE
ncbi:hypothetical protein BN946_scf184855.g19 [Trametes cinnabarina]|uniref:Uncharacterized protein n=1 Tax=Pycnoporus cinnabarinus TaxID=5643 RepID=A0A060SML6_PYCCI|nr:hypothetical protein BN946_scf184855.g19 [Trametes cinnabarina]